MKPQLFVSHYRSKLQRATYIARQDKTHLAFLGEKKPTTPKRWDVPCRQTTVLQHLVLFR